MVYSTTKPSEALPNPIVSVVERVVKEQPRDVPNIKNSQKIYYSYSILYTMKKPTYHILVCNSFRIAGDAQGFCNKNGASNLLQYISEEASDRGLDVAVSSTACLNVCSQGLVMVIHPNNYWYGGVKSESIIDEILDALEEGECCEKYSIAD
jgi:(2Fe-2S) ferredoxin